MPHKYYIIYKIVDTFRNNKIYIGQHITENINDNYYGSGTLLKKEIRLWKKKGRKIEDRFKKEILFVFDNYNEMNEKEKEIVNEAFLKGNTYNCVLGGSLRKSNRKKYKKIVLPDNQIQISPNDSDISRLYEEVIYELS